MRTPSAGSPHGQTSAGHVSPLAVPQMHQSITTRSRVHPVTNAVFRSLKQCRARGGRRADARR
eukprot:223841-Prymnesium_polylepis.1